MLCVLILYISAGDLRFKVDFGRQIFWETFHGNYIYFAEFLPEICWEEIAKEILFVFRFDVWRGTRTLAFRLIGQHITYYITAIPLELRIYRQPKDDKKALENPSVT